MADAVAGGSLKQDSAFNLALTPRPFEDDLVDPVLYPHLASTKLSHCRREQKMLMLSIGIERFLDLRERFHSYSIARLKTQGYARTVLCSRTRHKSPTSESSRVRDLVVGRNEQALHPLKKRNSIVGKVPQVLFRLPKGQRSCRVKDFTRLAKVLSVMTCQGHEI